MEVPCSSTTSAVNTLPRAKLQGQGGRGKAGGNLSALLVYHLSVEHIAARKAAGETWRGSHCVPRAVKCGVERLTGRRGS